MKYRLRYRIGSRNAPASHNMSVISRRPRRPFPSRNGWIVSNCTWASPALISGGSSGSSACRTFRRRRGTHSTGRAAVGRTARCPGACLRSNSASGGTRRAACGAASRPEQDRMHLPHKTQRQRKSAPQRGIRAPSPPRSLIPRLTSSSGTSGISSFSNSSRSESDDWVPSIWDDSRASLRTYMYRNSGVDGSVVVTPSSRPTAPRAESYRVNSPRRSSGGSGGGAGEGTPLPARHPPRSRRIGPGGSLVFHSCSRHPLIRISYYRISRFRLVTKGCIFRQSWRRASRFSTRLPLTISSADHPNLFAPDKAASAALATWGPARRCRSRRRCRR